MAEYRQYLTDGMSAARQGCGAGARILTLDLGNPFPLLLGWPPGGTMLILQPNRMLSTQARPSDAEIFRDVDWVLVPKMPVQLAAREFMLDTYGPYLSQKYTESYESKWRKILRQKTPQ